MGLKKHNPGIRFSGIQVTPEEIDRYEVYTIINPSTNEAFLGTCAVAGTSATEALVLDNVLLDYPRSLVEKTNLVYPLLKNLLLLRLRMEVLNQELRYFPQFRVVLSLLEQLLEMVQFH